MKNILIIGIASVLCRLLLNYHASLKEYPIVSLEQALASNFNEILLYKEKCSDGCSRYRLFEGHFFFSANENRVTLNDFPDETFNQLMEKVGFWNIYNVDYNDEFRISFDIENIFGRDSGIDYVLPYEINDRGDKIFLKNNAYQRKGTIDPKSRPNNDG